MDWYAKKQYEDLKNCEDNLKKIGLVKCLNCGKWISKEFINNSKCEGGC